MRNFGVFMLGLVLLSAVSRPVSADQYGPYQGPQPNLSILVDKLVGVPSTNNNGETTYSYVDNLGVGDFKFKPENLVFFKIKVRNTSNANLENVVIKDTAPTHVDLFDNPGTFDSNTRVLTISVGTLAVNEEKEYIVRGKVTRTENISGGITCVVNRAVASNDKVSDDDTAQLCIEKGVLGESFPPVKKIPSTGPEAGIFIIPFSGALAFVGRRLRKVS